MTAHLIDAGQAADRLHRRARPAISRRRSASPAIATRSPRTAAGRSRWWQGDFTEQSGARAAGLLLAGPRPDAIFAANDMMAIGCLQALREAGLRVPDDVALAGFDDIPISRFLDPPLTTVGVPIAELGRQAVECCVEILATGAPRRQPHLHARTRRPRLVRRAIQTGRRAQHQKRKPSHDRIRSFKTARRALRRRLARDHPAGGNARRWRR